MIITSWDDNRIIIWDTKKRKKIVEELIDPEKGKKIKYGASTLSDLPDNQCSRSVAFNNKYGHIAVAKNTGTV